MLTGLPNDLGLLFDLLGLLAPALLGFGARAAVSRSEEDDDDLELVLRARAGDRNAFNRLIRRYQKRIYNFSYRMLHDVDEAEEITQDVFVKLHANLRRFRADSKFSTWLYQIAKNLSLNRLKHIQRRNRFFYQSIDDPRRGGDNEMKLELPDERKDSEALFEEFELQSLVQRKIGTLREDYRTALILRDIEGLRYDEIAEIMQLAEGTVKSRIHRARMQLRESLDGYF